jgi:hypothetical protein
VGQTNPTLTCRNGSTTVGLVRFGPDQFRHANELETRTRDAQGTWIYEMGAHTLKFGGEWNETQIFNLFVPNSDGTYYFDSIADFQAGRANELIYRCRAASFRTPGTSTTNSHCLTASATIAT